MLEMAPRILRNIFRNWVFAIQELVKQCEDLKVKYNEEMTERKKLFNELQESKGNIRVFCRCRPLNKDEISAGCTTVLDFGASKDGILTTSMPKKQYRFDRVYTPKDDQVDVFADASSMVTSVLDGYNVCIFAYGPTGAGKTFTMEGTELNRGVNYRTLELLFDLRKKRSDTFSYDISVSVLEVYNEQIRDLLATGSTTKRLEIKQGSKGSHYIPGVVEAKVENVKEAWDVLQAECKGRADLTGTKLLHSIRSSLVYMSSLHQNEISSLNTCNDCLFLTSFSSILCIMVMAKNLLNGECTKSKLRLVNLAGSERLAKTDVQGERLKETQNINLSLSALGTVISALAVKSRHIPYRNSKLTHLLEDSLGGDSKTLMFLQISPSDKDLDETLSSLNFATRVRGVVLGSGKMQVDTSELQKTKAMLEELEGQIELKTSMQNQSEKQISQLSEKLKIKEETCRKQEEKMKELEKKLKEQEQSSAMLRQQVTFYVLA
ncbi:kinesin-like protein KIN-14R [Arachis ipaensis]|uniref:kinesin-like protein KIN-14R n=1 Tax=Arachis ipaensis TaxID=130454 RepID=UPI000A2B012B|nr:kinesin-like protein KIN-14R [Arachis ipaensis]